MNNKRLRNSGIINSKSLINDNKQKQIKKKNRTTTMNQLKMTTDQ